jgi:hypothetical protein
VLGLYLEAAENTLPLFDPATDDQLLTPQERLAQSEAENEQLQRELVELRRRQS